MGIMYTMPLTPARQGSPIQITETAILAAVGENDIALYAGDTVPLYRQMEMINAWRWLYNGVRDRNVFRIFAADTVVYSTVDIDKIGEPDRRTSSLFAEILANDVAIGIGQNVGLTGARSVDTTVILENAFGMLIDHARQRGMLVA